MDLAKLKEAVANYQPNSEVMTGTKRLRVLAVVGTTASGKTTIINQLARMAPEVQLVLNETSRPPRDSDQPGVDLLFRSRQAIIDDMEAGRLVQIAIGPNGDLYCTRLSGYPSGVGIIPLVPASVKRLRTLPMASFAAAYIVPADFGKWRQWLDQKAKSSHWTAQQLQDRLAEAKSNYQFGLADKKMRFVLNDSVEKAARRLWYVAQGEKPNDEAEARRLAEANYQKL